MKYKIIIPFYLAIAIFLNACSSSSDNDNSTNNDGNPTNSINANKKITGSSSNDLLSDDTFKSMAIELVYVQGYEPTQAAIDNFVSFLEARTFKPSGITVSKRAVSSFGGSTYSIQDIIDIEDINRTKYNTADQIAVWAIFVDGKSDKDTDTSVILGTAYRNTSFVIYEKTIQEFSNSPFEPDRSLLETTVITHEFGHILGLTNLGTALQSNHEDVDHPKHCNVESCLMFWQAESGSGIDNLMGSGTAPQLDSQCIADLQANGGK